MIREASPLILLLVLASCGSDPVDPMMPPAPPSTFCRAEEAEPANAFELGTTSDPFVPLGDGAVVRSVIGLQGGQMMGVRALVMGSAPACVDLHLEAIDGEGTFALLDRAVTMHATEGGWISMPLWLVFDGIKESGAGVTVVGISGAQRAEFDVWLDNIP